MSCRRWRRRGGARSRSRCSSRRPRAIPSISARSPSRCATSLQLLGDREPLLVAVDDVQWLDPSSSSALAFALRRLDASRVLVLLARRLADGAQPSELEQALGAERVQRLPVGPLSVGALHRLLRDRLGRSFARQTLLRIHERSGGNPFFALELARALDGDVDPLEPLPVPETLEELVRARISGLPAATREALALAAALGHALGVAARAGGRRGGRARAGGRRARDRARRTGRFASPIRCCRRSSTGTSATKRRSVHGRIARHRRRSAPPRPSPRAVDGRAGRRGRGRRSTTPRGWRPIAARRPSRPSSPSRRSG